MSNPNPLIQPKMICPHCWEGFYADKALYISRHGELKGDPVLGPLASHRLAPHEIRRDQAGNALDGKGWKMLERACPHCRLQIPPELLIRRPFFLSVVGAPRSGKTYFLTSMVHWLRKELARSFGYALNDSDSHDVKAFQEYEKTLFFPADASIPTLLKKTEEQGGLYNVVRLEGIDVQLPRPFIFSLRPTEANLDAPKLGTQLHQNIVLYDNAGESFEALRDSDLNIRVTQHLCECDAVLFTFDPLQDPEARQRLMSVSQDPQLSKAAVSHRQETILSELINRIRRYRSLPEHKKLKPLLAVAVQKYDVWKSLVPFSQPHNSESGPRRLIDHSSVEFSDRHGIAGLDVEEINMNSLLIRSFVNDINPQFVALAESHFKVVRYFPVSALGTSPAYDTTAGAGAANILKIRPVDVQPFRVTDPMLWLFHRWNLIRVCRRRTENAQKYRRAAIQSCVAGKLRILSPATGRVISLDKEYAGSTIIDPFSGEQVWIPELPQSGVDDSTEPNEEARLSPPEEDGDHKPAPSASTATSPPPEASLTLKLDPTPKPPRRGWFRKP